MESCLGYDHMVSYLGYFDFFFLGTLFITLAFKLL